MPYDTGLQALLGTDTEQLFGWTRNHYDRLVHLMYGVCFGVVGWQWHRRARRGILTSAWLAVEFVLASSALYEIAEWLIAITMAPDWADSYLGQQGDPWDAIKDMALAGIGASAVVCWTTAVSAWRSPQLTAAFSDGGRPRQMPAELPQFDR